MATEPRELTVLMDDVEAGMVSFCTDHFMDLIDKYKAVAVHLDSDHGIFFLCEHPATKEWEYHSLLELLDPEKPKEAGDNITPFRKPLN